MQAGQCVSPEKTSTFPLTPKLGFGSSFWHGQADEAR